MILIEEVLELSLDCVLRHHSLDERWKVLTVLKAAVYIFAIIQFEIILVIKNYF